MDAETGQPVVVDVYVDDQRLREGATRLDLTVKLAPDHLTEIRVEAPGCHPWGVAARGGGEGHRMEGPIQLIPVKLSQHF